jgi:lipid-binding SYLF domain-containing protein
MLRFALLLVLVSGVTAQADSKAVERCNRSAGVLEEILAAGDASVAAGPVSRTVKAETDIQLRAEILSYSRSRGIFAGVSLSGATLRGDRDVDSKIYGHYVSRRDILSGAVESPSSCLAFGQILFKYSSQEHK